MRNLRLIFCLLSIWLGLLQAINAQAQNQITGKVTSAAGEVLPGVTVLLKGTSNGTTTNANGTYTLSVPVTSGTLVFSFIGYTTLERNFSQPGTLNVTLATDVKALDEVVVTALGIKREAKKLGYATSTVSTEQITTTRTTNVGNSLVGKVAGLNVQAPPTGAGGSSKIRIRGQSSFGGNNSPLIIVNGVPINNSAGGLANNAGVGFAGEARTDTGDGLQSINPDDIESMTVLKGAAAAALYGFRAKDGAIIITTKSGKGQVGIGVELNSNFQADEALDYTDFQYVYGQGEGGKRPATVSDARSSGVFSFGEKFDGQPTIAHDGELHPYSPNKNRVKDFYRTGTTWTNSVALSGGSEKGNFRLSFANTDANGIIPNSDFHKKILNFGLNYNLSEKLSAQLNANYSNEYSKNPPVVVQQDYNINQTLYTLANSIDVKWLEAAYVNPATGNEINPARFTNRTNPYWTINKRLEENRRDRIFGNASVRYQFAPWLYAQGRIGQDYFTNPYNANRPTGTAFLGGATTGFNGNFYQSASTFRERNLDFLVGANKTFGDFGIDATFGGNTMDQKADRLGTSVTNFYVRDLYTIGNGQIKEPNYSFSHKRVNSLYGTVDFSFRNFLFLNVTGRNDWFSTLNPESNSYLYPSVSSSFVFSQAFGTLPAWLNYGKVRAAYAEVGGDTDPYTNALFYSLNANPFGPNNIALGNISGSVSPNPNLRPLKVKEAEAGLELKTLDNRINLDLAVYRKNTVDEILNVDISNASGYSQTKVNVGKLRNQGVEMLLSLVPVRTENLNWESAFNLTVNKSKVIQLANNQQRFDTGTGEFIGIVSHEVGQPLASVRGFDYKRDEQGRIITSAGRFLQGDLVTYGSAVPTHTGGWLNTLTYKGIRLFAQIDFKAGHKLISNSNFNWYRHGLHQASLVGREEGVVMDAVNANGSPNTTSVPVQDFYTLYRGTSVATPFVYNASFVRWRTVSLGYDLSRFVNKSFVKGLSMNLFVNNVLIIKKYVDNLDPESQYSASDALNGLESHSLPTTRSYGLNVNVKL
ncbi:SusC/RagA family TonB-linked outer membrane protein [Adhaeribacter aerolatus]|uniref:SusC/RagA family TonB-linked outer membrane protein n=1 Tax=Adhaeribacter aerolatus TaxID=670289 RepID=A0A512AT60_9BACT|nr:SusC/RagA family TonB-linked outer membrane protein [Adhaeribacter aerolatus]GEO02878.1 SusC/RagA family TonB-linked outer membrane protein [Adhaeribacter aerolatus]